MMLSKALALVEESIEGYLLMPGQHGYEQHRKVFNAMVDRRPVAIVRCRTTADAKHAIRVVVDHDVPFTIRAGGHNVAGLAVGDAKVMVDLSELRRVRIDPERRRAFVEPGALWADLDRAAFAYGLATTGGIVSHTGVGGLVLGGGLGWLMGAFGLACDSLIGLDVLDGQLREHRITPGHPELWAFRGAGRSMGFTASFEFQLHPLPARTIGGRLVVDDLGRALGTFGEAHARLPDEITVSPALCRRSSGEAALVVDFFSLAPEVDTRRAVVDAFDSPVPPEALGPITYPRFQASLDDDSRFGCRNYWRSSADSALSPDLVGDIVGAFLAAPSSQTMVTIDHVHGRAMNEPEGGSAYSLRDRPFVILFNTIWTDRSHDEINISWARTAHSSLDPGGVLTYGNYLDSDEPSASRAFSAGVLDRLRRVKAEYDPDDRFPAL